MAAAVPRSAAAGRKQRLPAKSPAMAARFADRVPAPSRLRLRPIASPATASSTPGRISRSHSREIPSSKQVMTLRPTACRALGQRHRPHSASAATMRHSPWPCRSAQRGSSLVSGGIESIATRLSRVHTSWRGVNDSVSSCKEGFPMNSFILWATLGFVPLVPAIDGSPNCGCPVCDCCRCCETDTCDCAECLCECCVDECPTVGVTGKRENCCGSGCCGSGCCGT
jgi:hypothetical protein